MHCKRYGSTKTYLASNYIEVDEISHDQSREQTHNANWFANYIF